MKRIVKLLAVAGATLIAMSSCCNSSSTESTSEAATQAVLDNISTRTSIRKFTDEAVSDAQIEKLLRAAMCAPTAMNSQPWRFVVVKDKKILATLAEKMPYARLDTAPVAIVVCGDHTGYCKFWEHDCSAAAENILLAAHALGLGGVWTAASDDKRAPIVTEELGLPSYITPLCVIPVGHPAENPEPKDKWKAENVHYDRW